LCKTAIGIDLGATNVRVGLGDSQGRILKKLVEKTEKRRGPEGIPRQLIRMVHHILRDWKAPIHGIGVGCIGPLDRRSGTIVNSPNIPFKKVALVEHLQREFPGPVTLMNDGNAGVLGEKTVGAGRHVDHLAYVTLSTGIGGGVIVDGRLLEGKDGNAAEVGHLVIDSDGRLLCGCGKQGHWEAYCSGENIPRYAKLCLQDRSDGARFLLKVTNGNPEALTTQIIFDTAKTGDSIACSLVDAIGRRNAAGFANIINAYDPSRITVGGTLALKHPQLILAPLKKHLHRYVLNRLPEIAITSLGDDIVLHGALAMVFQPSRKSQEIATS
jgi:glucokinase